MRVPDSHLHTDGRTTATPRPLPRSPIHSSRDLPVEDDGTMPDFTVCRRPGAKPLVVAGKVQRAARVSCSIGSNEPRTLTPESVAILQFHGGRLGLTRSVGALRLRGIGFCELTRANEWPSGPENVALCTIHSAKGLEFDHVLLPGLSGQVTPHGPEEGDAGS